MAARSSGSTASGRKATRRAVSRLSRRRRPADIRRRQPAARLLADSSSCEGGAIIPETMRGA
ncbi:hypothetical protein C7S17_7471 [Burkholderia thailandensis]|nr:hypothetical protein [Burkholderia thailandensis]